MQKPSPALLIALLFALHLCSHCRSLRDGGDGDHGQGGTNIRNITVVGTVFCDACCGSSFSSHSYFLPGVKVRIDCMFRVNSASKEQITITTEKTTDKYGVYELDIPPIDEFQCKVGRATESFCRATVIENPSSICSVPALTNSVEHTSLMNQEGDACLYNLNALYYRPSKKDTKLCDKSVLSAPPNTSLFFWPFFPPFGSPWPHWPHLPFPFASPPSLFPPIPFLTPPPSLFPPIPFLTPPPSLFPPIPFLTPPPPSLPFPFPPIPFFTPPPPPTFPFPLPPWPWTPPKPNPPSLPFPPIFQPPPSPPPPSFPFPFPPLSPFPWFASPPPPPPPPPPSLPLPPWPFPPLPFVPPSSPTPSPPPPPRFSWRDPRTWFRRSPPPSPPKQP